MYKRGKVRGTYWVWTGRRSWCQTARRPVHVSVQAAAYWLQRTVAWTKMWRQKQNIHSLFNTTEHKPSEIWSTSVIKSKLRRWCLMLGVFWRILQNGLISTIRQSATLSMILVITQSMLIENFRGYLQFLHSKCQSITCIRSWRLPFKQFPIY
jgi:hypothetical protein